MGFSGSTRSTENESKWFTVSIGRQALHAMMYLEYQSLFFVQFELVHDGYGNLSPIYFGCTRYGFPPGVAAQCT